MEAIVDPNINRDLLAFFSPFPVNGLEKLPKKLPK